MENKYDSYAFPKNMNNGGLAGGFIDACTAAYFKPGDKAAEKNSIRETYMREAKKKQYKLSEKVHINPDFSHLPGSSWLGIEVKFKLLSPWYSKDDRPFHILDNPVRKDKVFGVPFMSSSTWKGLLRWACRMEEGLLNHLKDNNMDEWKEPEWIEHLFGSKHFEERDSEHFRGALTFYPTWFDRISYEVINPHARSTRAGSNPIYYEVVPAPTEGKLQLLYVPGLGRMKYRKIEKYDTVTKLVGAIRGLLDTYGISAKRTSGWGAVEITGVGTYSVEGSWLKSTDPFDSEAKYTPPEDKFKELMDDDGVPIRILLDETGKLLSNTKFKRLEDSKPDCTKSEFTAFREWYRKNGDKFRNQLYEAEEVSAKETTFQLHDSLEALRNALVDARKGGTV